MARRKPARVRDLKGRSSRDNGLGEISVRGRHDRRHEDRLMSPPGGIEV